MTSVVSLNYAFYSSQIYTLTRKGFKGGKIVTGKGFKGGKAGGPPGKILGTTKEIYAPSKSFYLVIKMDI